MVPWKQRAPGNSVFKLSINHSTTVRGTCLQCPCVSLGSPGLSSLLPPLPSILYPLSPCGLCSPNSPKGLGADWLLSGFVFADIGRRPVHVLGRCEARALEAKTVLQQLFQPERRLRAMGQTQRLHCCKSHLLSCHWERSPSHFWALMCPSEQISPF